MAIRQVMVSDLTGAEAEEGEFVTLTVREHGGIDEPRALDVLPDEIKNLKTVSDLVVLEVSNGNGEKDQVVMTLGEFRKVCSDDVLKKARKTRGRRPGTVLNKS